MRKRGVLVGIRRKNGRQVYIYMFRDLFAEIQYKNDSAEEDAEILTVVSGLKELNNHLENELKAGR
jgi:hypothetical protein